MSGESPRAAGPGGRIGGRIDSAKARIAAGTGHDELFRLAERLESVEEAVAENALLAERLTAQVHDLEQALIGPLERRVTV